jgi:hypothetical protein
MFKGQSGRTKDLYKASTIASPSLFWPNFFAFLLNNFRSARRSRSHIWIVIGSSPCVYMSNAFLSVSCDFALTSLYSKRKKGMSSLILRTSRIYVAKRSISTGDAEPNFLTNPKKNSHLVNFVCTAKLASPLVIHQSNAEDAIAHFLEDVFLGRLVCLFRQVIVILREISPLSCLVQCFFR